ncbi:MAG: cysteine--tRNA ligase [Kiritimatiellia bacterium]
MKAEKLKFYNTLTRRLEKFEPRERGSVGMYTCGPTVYDFAHIGNFRAYVFEDLLRRCLRYAGYGVTQVMNLTDVDDKTIKGARQAGVPLGEYTRKYKDAFFEDLKVLNIERAEYYPEATAHVGDMIEMVQKLLDKGHAYRAEDGSVYFRISSFEDYGKLARIDTSGLRAGARVSHDEYEKDDAADFALWKGWTREDGDVAWETPWGRGRPGWHIECSAMSTRYLGETFDIHTGGVDNIFPHHEDEIAQSEAASGKQFVKYWLHCEHLIMEGRKMSKSLGNFFTLRDILERGYTGREIRYVLMAGHYRQRLNFTFEALDGARTALERIDEFRGRLREADSGCFPEVLPCWAEKCRKSFEERLAGDMNVSGALGSLFDMVHDGNRAMDAEGKAPAGWSPAAVDRLMARFEEVLGVLAGSGEETDEETRELARRRETARKNRDWQEADRLRDEITKRGWEVRDTPGGPKLKKR